MEKKRKVITKFSRKEGDVLSREAEIPSWRYQEKVKMLRE